jgi:hypothetical protein
MTALHLNSTLGQRLVPVIFFGPNDSPGALDRRPHIIARNVIDA